MQKSSYNLVLIKILSNEPNFKNFILKKFWFFYTQFRPNYRQFHAYPGRPQLLKFSSSQMCSKDIENESKLEKFSTLLNAELLNLMELKKLSWSGIPRKVCILFDSNIFFLKYFQILKIDASSFMASSLRLSTHQP